MKRMRTIAAAVTLMCGVVCGNLCALDLSVIRVDGNALRFSVSTRGDDGKGVLQHEIAR